MDTNKEYDMRFLALQLFNFFTTVFVTGAVYMGVLVYCIIVRKTLSIGDWIAFGFCVEIEPFKKFEDYQNEKQVWHALEQAGWRMVLVVQSMELLHNSGDEA